MELNKRKNKAGRPTNYTTELVREICVVIATTSKGIKILCKENPHWPSHKTIYLWLMNHKEFSDLYARAKRQQVEVIVDEILTIADDSTSDSHINENGNLVVDHEHINRARLRIDTRKWIAAKLVPRLYGENVGVRELGEEIAEFKRKFGAKLNDKADSLEESV